MSTAIETQRLDHINKLMNDINDSSSDIYEALVDRDFKSLVNVIDCQIERLQDLRNSVCDE